MALRWWPGGYEPAAAACRLDADGRLTVVTGAADMTGVSTAFAAIAAEAFGLDPSRVRVVQADTASAPYAGISGGSKVTYTVGRAVQRAALRGARSASGGRPRSCASAATTPVEGHGHSAQPPAPQAAAHLSHLRVDPSTGAVRVLSHVVAQDVGRALNPALVRGQMHGGVAQGPGSALLEELVHDRDGQLTSGTLVDYGLPTAALVPPIEAEIVEVPAPEGPYGAKGVGEAPVVGAAAAVANALAAATGGVRMRRLPMSPERVWRALERDRAAAA